MGKEGKKPVVNRKRCGSVGWVVDKFALDHYNTITEV
jgi:hypothetical protein